MGKRATAKENVALAALVVVVVGVVGGVMSCYGPTEVTLDISRDTPCSPPGQAVTGIFVGAEGHGAIDPIAETTDCSPANVGSSIGSLVVVPSGDRDGRATVEVVLALAPKQGGPLKSTKECLIDATDCIVARRSFSFIAHASRRIPITLYEACRNLTCGAGTTCVAGKCGTDDIDSPAFCDNGGCKDGGVPDSGPTPLGVCSGPAGDGVVTTLSAPPLGNIQSNATTLFWRTADGAAVESVRKDGSQRGVVFAPGGVTALAIGAAGTTGWVAANTRMYKLALPPDGGAASASSDMEFSTQPVLSIAAPGASVYFSVATATFKFAGTPPAFPIPIPPAVSGTSSVPAGSASGYGAFRLSSRAPSTGDITYGLQAKRLHRHQSNVAVPIDVQNAADVLAVPGGAYVGEGPQIAFVDESGNTSKPVAAASTPDFLAHDGTTLFWVEFADTTRAASTIMRLEGDAGVPVGLPRKDKVVGLVVDSQCVYYWASGAIRSAPKRP